MRKPTSPLKALRACSHISKLSDCETDFLQNKAKIRRCTSRIFNLVMLKIRSKMGVERLCKQALTSLLIARELPRQDACRGIPYQKTREFETTAVLPQALVLDHSRGKARNLRRLTLSGKCAIIFIAKLWRYFSIYFSGSETEVYVGSLPLWNTQQLPTGIFSTFARGLLQRFPI